MANRVALITGGTRGIGLGIAKRLAGKGFDVVVTGRRSSDEAQAALDELRNASAVAAFQAKYICADVSDISGHRLMLEEVDAVFGRLDVLVNNAGISPTIRADVMDASEQSFDELIATNLKGPYFLTQSVASWMIRQRDNDTDIRYIINIGSISATVASVNRGDYCITKAGIAMATKLWATRLAQEGISVFEVQPGIVETDMTAGVKEKYNRLIDDGLILERRWGTPDDVGRVVATLASGDLPYSTGAVVVTDGGLTLPRL